MKKAYYLESLYYDTDDNREWIKDLDEIYLNKSKAQKECEERNKLLLAEINKKQISEYETAQKRYQEHLVLQAAGLRGEDRKAPILYTYPLNQIASFTGYWSLQETVLNEEE
jgi:hypothetical protein